MTYGDEQMSGLKMKTDGALAFATHTKTDGMNSNMCYCSGSKAANCGWFLTFSAGKRWLHSGE